MNDLEYNYLFAPKILCISGIRWKKIHILLVVYDK